MPLPLEAKSKGFGKSGFDFARSTGMDEFELNLWASIEIENALDNKYTATDLQIMLESLLQLEAWHVE